VIGTDSQMVRAKDIAPEMREIRVRTGLTQYTLAAALGVTRRTISRWECGRGRLHRVWLVRMRALPTAKLPEVTQEEILRGA
jgi:transcriptional regulator with XRE-family HTH domain